MVDTSRRTIADIVGPAFTIKSLSARFGKPESEIRAAIEAGDILSLPTTDGVNLMPASQFGPDGQPLPGLRVVLAELRRGHDDAWLHAQFLAAKSPLHDDRTIAGELRAGELLDVLALAIQTAEAWSA
ncbi:hypothetical protein ACPPVQ_05790 [Diaminobutyricibacter sp. McL0618]|uniref:hypothetical protein n=1 Tax=Leifsonia sp. McL0618 TaxID=3415677 RepID=UPI003CF0B1C4